MKIDFALLENHLLQVHSTAGMHELLIYLYLY